MSKQGVWGVTDFFTDINKYLTSLGPVSPLPLCSRYEVELRNFETLGWLLSLRCLAPSPRHLQYYPLPWAFAHLERTVTGLSTPFVATVASALSARVLPTCWPLLTSLCVFVHQRGTSPAAVGSLCSYRLIASSPTIFCTSHACLSTYSLHSHLLALLPSRQPPLLLLATTTYPTHFHALHA